MIPFLTLLAQTRSSLPTWAVAEFRDLKGGAYGKTATDAFAVALEKTGAYVVVRDAARLGNTVLRPTASDYLARLASETLGASAQNGAIVLGEVLDYRVAGVAGGRQAAVGVRLVVYDAASGEPVNGALVRGDSPVETDAKASDPPVEKALAAAMAGAVERMRGQTPLTATVLNATPRVALINQGTRSGFKTGMRVLVTRRRETVATAVVGVVEPDQAELAYESSHVLRAMVPGDRVQALFDPPPLPRSGRPILERGGLLGEPLRPRSARPRSAPLSQDEIVRLLAQVAGPVGRVTAEATLDPRDGSPAVRVSWSPNGGFKHEGRTEATVDRWQIFRDGVAPHPVGVVDAASRFIFDGVRPFDRPFSTYLRVGDEKPRPSLDDAPVADHAPLAPGRPAVYRVEAVYHVSDPVGYFLSPRTASGTATPIARPALLAPAEDAVLDVAQPVRFRLASVVSSPGAFVPSYVVELSDDPSFPRARTVRTPLSVVPEITLVLADAIRSRPALRQAALYWRAGARNRDDRPGPVKDPLSGQRFVYSAARRLKPRPSSEP